MASCLDTHTNRYARTKELSTLSSTTSAHAGLLGLVVVMVARPMAIGMSAIVLVNRGARYRIEENQDSTCLSIWHRYLLNRLGPYDPYDPATNKLQASAVRSR